MPGRGNAQPKLLRSRSTDAADLAAPGQGHRLDNQVLRPSRRLHTQAKTVQLRAQHQPVDARIGHGFEPYGLPDARGRCIKDALVFVRLFAARLPALSGIGDRHYQFLFALCPEGRRKIEAERVIPAAMFTQQLTVDPDLTGPVHRPQVNSHSAAGPGLRHTKGAPIPKPFIRPQTPAHAAEGRFNRERHQNPAIPPCGTLRAHDRSHGVVPQPVQIEPVGPDHLGARILGPYLVGTNRSCPTGQQRSRHDPPLLGHAREGCRPSPEPHQPTQASA